MQRLVKYSRKVSAIFFIWSATQTTWNTPSTQSTYVFCAGESDSDEENSESVEGDLLSIELEETVEGAIPTLQAEILELDTMGFDEALLIDETLDMYNIKDV